MLSNIAVSYASPVGAGNSGMSGRYTQTQTGAAAANVGTQPVNQWANAGGPNGENVTYLHLDPALTRSESGCCHSPVVDNLSDLGLVSR
jgi:hypothetical protein